MKQSTTYERCVPLLVEAWLPTAISATALQANSDEQDDDRKISAQRVGRTTLRVPTEVLCVGQPSAEHREEPTVPKVTVYMFKCRGVPEMLKKMLVPTTAQNHQPPVQSQTASTQQAKAQSGAAVPRAKKNILLRFPSSHRASPQLPSPTRELESLTTNLINRSQTTVPSDREVLTLDRPVEQRPQREDRGLRRP